MRWMGISPAFLLLPPPRNHFPFWLSFLTAASLPCQTQLGSVRCSSLCFVPREISYPAQLRSSPSVLREEVERDPLELQGVWRPGRSCQWRRAERCQQEAVTMERVPGAGRGGWVQEHRSLRKEVAGFSKHSSSILCNKAVYRCRPTSLGAAPFRLHLKVVSSAWSKTGKSAEVSLLSPSPLLSRFSYWSGHPRSGHLPSRRWPWTCLCWCRRASLQVPSIRREAGRVPGALEHIILYSWCLILQFS